MPAPLPVFLRLPHAGCLRYQGGAMPPAPASTPSDSSRVRRRVSPQAGTEPGPEEESPWVAATVEGNSSPDPVVTADG